MNFVDASSDSGSKQRSNLVGIHSSRSPDADNYEFSLSFYSMPPNNTITLEDCDNWVIERINLLNIIDDKLKSHGTIRPTERTDVDNCLKKSCSKYDKNFYHSAKLNEEKDKDMARRRDHVSHYLLRLYYCRSEELRRWFINVEHEFFRFRLFDLVESNELSKFLAFNGLSYDQVIGPEKLALFDQIDWNNVKSTKPDPNSVMVYKLAFEDALDLIRLRKVYLNNGYAYILAQDMITVIANKFRSDLSKSLALIQLYLTQLDEDKRLIPRIHSMHTLYVENRKKSLKSEFGKEYEQITAEMIDSLAKESFAPCMRNIHDILRKEHHLRHYGRLHYGLFLKAIGLGLDDAMQFFRDEFIQKVSADRFQKDYAYNIRYNYGKEGKKVNISAYSCAKIINENAPQQVDTHGCPFRHFDHKNLQLLMKKYGVNDDIIQEIIKSVEEKNYSMACSKYFSAKHPWYPPLEQNVYHPNQFYMESRKALKLQTLTPPESANMSQTSVDAFDNSEITMNDISETLDAANISLINDIQISDNQFMELN